MRGKSLGNLGALCLFHSLFFSNSFSVCLNFDPKLLCLFLLVGPSKEAVQVAGLTGVVKGEGLMKDSESRRLYNRRGHEAPTSNPMLPNTKDIMISSNPRRLYNRRGAALLTTTSPPVLSNPRSGREVV